jgi:hypothetical protein
VWDAPTKALSQGESTKVAALWADEQRLRTAAAAANAERARVASGGSGASPATSAQAVCARHAASVAACLQTQCGAAPTPASYLCIFGDCRDAKPSPEEAARIAEHNSRTAATYAACVGSARPACPPREFTTEDSCRRDFERATAGGWR